MIQTFHQIPGLLPLSIDYRGSTMVMQLWSELHICVYRTGTSCAIISLYPVLFFDSEEGRIEFIKTSSTPTGGVFDRNLLLLATCLYLYKSVLCHKLLLLCNTFNRSLHRKSDTRIQKVENGTQV